MTKPVRKGYLTRYKKRILGSNWREEWAVLHEDSTLEWYKDHDESDLIGAIELKEAPEMIAAGPFACYVPNRPELPKNTDPNNLMVFGNKGKDRTHWFLCKNMDDLNFLHLLNNQNHLNKAIIAVESHLLILLHRQHLLSSLLPILHTQEEEAVPLTTLNKEVEVALSEEEEVEAIEEEMEDEEEAGTEDKEEAGMEVEAAMEEEEEQTRWS